MSQFWDNDDLLDKAKALLAESPDDLKARLVAQAMRLQQEAVEHVAAMATHTAYPPAVVRIADMLEKHPHMVEPVTRLIESTLRDMINSLPAEGET